MEDAELLAQLGIFEARLGNWARSAHFLRKALARDDNRDDYKLLLAEACVRVNDFVSALKWISALQAKQLYPDELNALRREMASIWVE